MPAPRGSAAVHLPFLLHHRLRSWICLPSQKVSDFSCTRGREGYEQRVGFQPTASRRMPEAHRPNGQVPNSFRTLVFKNTNQPRPAPNANPCCFRLRRARSRHAVVFRGCSSSGRGPRVRRDLVSGACPAAGARYLRLTRRLPAPRSQAPSEMAPVSCSEFFSMAPLARGGHPTDYRMPKNFNLGSGKVKELQEKLRKSFETLAQDTNFYLDTKGRASHYGIEPFEELLAESKKYIRETRNEIVPLMISIYELGAEPLPPMEELDQDVSHILEVCSLVSAAKSAAKMKLPTTAPSNQQFDNASASCHEKSATTKFKTPANGMSRTRTSRSKAKTRIVSRGAAARARAEAAMNARILADSGKRQKTT